MVAHQLRGLGHTDRQPDMAHHGQIAIGATLAGALELAAEVEVLSEQYCKVLMLGRPTLLSAAEMADVIERFENYGR